VADKLSKAQRDARAQRAKMLLNVARAWEGRSDGRDNGYAARLRAEARTLAKDPDFADMDKQYERYKEIASTVTEETEAFHEKQVRAQGSPARVVTKPWHKDADPILNELHTKNPGWRAGRLRRELENQWGLERPKLPEPRAIERHIEKLLETGGQVVEAK
jgi:crotonobetainyl-CoA:carnitine CoA-transferase CaiB-like acyl-CoA transferase